MVLPPETSDYTNEVKYLGSQNFDRSPTDIKIEKIVEALEASNKRVDILFSSWLNLNQKVVEVEQQIKEISALLPTSNS